MASYFEEHNCTPLKDGETPNDLLHIARLLLNGGYMGEFDSLFADGRKPPPASKKVVQELETLIATQLDEAQRRQCPVCLAEFTEGEEMKRLPCDHCFHSKCILSWLAVTNSCPLCRHELPTDDEDYEEFKRQKAREKQRQYELESLHDSMFG